VEEGESDKKAVERNTLNPKRKRRRGHIFENPIGSEVKQQIMYPTDVPLARLRIKEELERWGEKGSTLSNFIKSKNDRFLKKKKSLQARKRSPCEG